MDLVAIARRYLGSGPSLFYAPDIPRVRVAGARRVHAHHLPSNEPILVLVDATLFGSGTEGLVMTAERLCYKNFFAHARQILWRELDPAWVDADPDGVVVSGDRIFLGAEVSASHARDALREIATACQSGRHGPYRADDRAVAGLSEGDIRTLAYSHVGTSSSLFFSPSIPPGKERAARKVHAQHLPTGEPVVLLYDATLLGGGSDGFLVTPRRLCIKNPFEVPVHVPWREVAPAAIAVDGEWVRLGSLARVAAGALAPRFAELFAALVSRA